MLPGTGRKFISGLGQTNGANFDGATKLGRSDICGSMLADKGELLCFHVLAVRNPKPLLWMTFKIFSPVINLDILINWFLLGWALLILPNLGLKNSEFRL